MLKIKIANVEFEYLEALETEEFYNGASRRTLTVSCAHDTIDLTKLNALLVEENLAVITLTNDEIGVTNYHEGYVLKLECGIKNTKVQPETLDAPAVYEDRLVFKLGKRTYIEEQLHRLGL
jgi:hypothetical protein